MIHYRNGRIFTAADTEWAQSLLVHDGRLAYVGVTRAKQDARISFAANRLVYGRWTSQLPSRFVDELPIDHVEPESETGYYGATPGMKDAKSRWDEAPSFGAGYSAGTVFVRKRAA